MNPRTEHRTDKFPDQRVAAQPENQVPDVSAVGRRHRERVAAAAIASMLDDSAPTLMFAPCWAIGTNVSVGGEIDGQVTAVCLRGERLTYEVVWWDGRCRRCEWLEECEISSQVKKQAGLGFRP